MNVELSWSGDIVMMTSDDLRKLADEMDKANSAGTDLHHPLGEIHMYPDHTVALVATYCYADV
jgi:hypothetical protein